MKKTTTTLKLFLLSCMFLIGFNLPSYAQKQQVENLVGTKLNNYLFNNVRYLKEPYGTEEVTLDDLRGKWLILYFWTQSCTPCVKKFPILNDFQKHSNGNSQILLVGINDQYNREIGAFYDGVKLIQKVHLPIAYDTVLVRKMKIDYAGTALFIDPNGVLKEVVLGDLTKRKIKSIIARKDR